MRFKTFLSYYLQKPQKGKDKMSKLSLNNKKTKIILIILAVITSLTGVTGAFFKIQPVYYAGMVAMGVVLLFIVIAFLKAAKEDKLEEIEERYEKHREQVFALPKNQENNSEIPCKNEPENMVIPENPENTVCETEDEYDEIEVD